MTPQRIAHVFPLDTRHLTRDDQVFSSMLLRRWPLAAVAQSQLARRSTVHLLGPRSRRDSSALLELVIHPSLFSGPRFRDWGDDWSLLLALAVRRLGPSDVCVLHLNDYAAARYAHRAAHRTRVVLVFHGRGLGRADDHLLLADRHVVLHCAAAEGLQELGVPADRVVIMQPSIDTGIFVPGELRGEELVLGFIGRLEGTKGVFEVPRVLAALPKARAELIGPATDEQCEALLAVSRRAGVTERLRLLGELPPEGVAERMRSWRLLLVPSYSEGSPLVVPEAAAARLPVAAVEGVLPRELARHPGIYTGPRHVYRHLVKRALSEERPPFADWVRGHAQAAEEWDALLEDLAPWKPRPPVAVPRVDRLKRFHPLRNAVRRMRRTSTAGANSPV